LLRHDFKMVAGKPALVTCNQMVMMVLTGDLSP
jgi:hypothetical protein